MSVVFSDLKVSIQREHISKETRRSFQSLSLSQQRVDLFSSVAISKSPPPQIAHALGASAVSSKKSVVTGGVLGAIVTGAMIITRLVLLWEGPLGCEIAPMLILPTFGALAIGVAIGYGVYRTLQKK